jgi:polar amino acid transport system ATP-binding protein
MMIATHEMAIAKDFADRVVFMVGGEVVEDAPSRTFFSNPTHERSRLFVLGRAVTA